MGLAQEYDLHAADRLDSLSGPLDRARTALTPLGSCADVSGHVCTKFQQLQGCCRKTGRLISLLPKQALHEPNT